MRDTAKLSLAFPYATPLNKSLQCKHAFSIIARVVEFGRVCITTVLNHQNLKKMGWTSQRAQGGGWRLPTVPYIVISA